MDISRMDLRYSDEQVRRDIPSFIEQPPPLIQNPFMRPHPEKCTNLLEKSVFDIENTDTELVQVYLRMKPCNVSIGNLYEIFSDKCLITSLDTATPGHGRRTPHNVSKMYTFTRIFKPECSQKEMFEQTVKDNLRKLVDGHSFTLLTYGASGSGKTYTVMGTVNSPGLVPRSLEYLFKLVDAAQSPIYRPTENGVDQLGQAEQNYELQWVKRICSVTGPIRDKYRRMSVQLHSDMTFGNIDLTNRTKYYIWVSFVEIYNDDIYDLLAPPEKRSKLRIREDSSGNVYVKGVIQAFVRSGEEAYNVMVAGKHNLIVAATGVHANSSRSHCIFTITMLTDNNGEIRTSQVRLCDLAGCERQQAARNTGARMKESRAINSSLHVLERCLHMLRRKQRLARDCAMVPYRESKLTRLLGAGLSGARGEAVSMVVTLNPAPQHAAQTKHVLSLAAVAKDIQVNQTLATTFSSLESSLDSTLYSSHELIKLRTENEKLHFELLQEQKCTQKLMWTIDENRQESAKVMKELVAETQASLKGFYEKKLADAEERARKMQEEYQDILAEKDEVITRLLKKLKKVNTCQCTTAHLHDRGEKLNENNHTNHESVAASAQTFIEAEELSSGSSDSEEDVEESLEPVRRQTIDTIMKNASRISMAFQTGPIIDLDKSNDENSEHETETDTENESDNVNIAHKEATNENVAHEDDSFKEDESKMSDTPVSKDSLYATGDEESDIEQSKHDNEDLTSNLTHTTFEKIDETPLNEDSVGNYIENDRSDFEQSFNVSIRVKKTKDVNISSNARGTSFVNDSELDKSNDMGNVISTVTRGTYFVNSSEDSKNSETREDVHEIKAVNNLRGSYVIAERELSFYEEKNIPDNTQKSESKIESEKNKDPSKLIEKSPAKDETLPQVTKNTGTEFVKPKQTFVNKILNSLKTRQSSNSSLKQFEQIETACNVESSPENDNPNSTFITNAHLPTLKDKKTYFDDSMQVETSNATTERSEVYAKSNTEKKSKFFDDSPDIVKPSFVCSGKLCLLSGAAKVQEKMLFDSPTNDMTSPVNQTKPDENKLTNDKHTNIQLTPEVNEAKLYFEDSDKVVVKEVLLSKSPSLVRDDICQDYVPSIAVKKILGQNFVRSELPTSAPKHLTERHESFDVFESPQVNILKSKPNAVNNIGSEIQTTQEPAKTNDIPNEFPNIKDKTVAITKKSVESDKEVVIKQEKVSLERTSFTQESTESIPNLKDNTKNEATKNTFNKPGICVNDIDIKIEPPTFNDTQSSNNTVDEFEKIVKDLTNVRVTEFDLLLAETETASDSNNKKNPNIPLKMHPTKGTEQNTKVNNKDTTDESEQNDIAERRKKFEEVKYNLRNKGKSINLNSIADKKESDKSLDDEKPKASTKRSLRLRRKQNCNDQDDTDSRKLKDICNLEKEFSDVTLGVPAVKKVVKDIPSPEKVAGEEENLPPMLGIQSCPSKSVHRSRRKLFTPRVEALEESPNQAGDSNERVYVRRPSYHRGRARRKL